MFFAKDNHRVKNGHNDKWNGNSAIPMIADLFAPKELVLYDIIDGSNDNKMETYNDECANRKVYNDVWLDWVKEFTTIYHSYEKANIDRVEQWDMDE